MRLQLTVVGALVAWPVLAAGQNAPEQVGAGRASAHLLVYSDDDATTVTTTTVDGEAVVQPRLRLGIHALVDVISSASADVVSAATERWTENRIEGGGRVSVDAFDMRLSAGVTRSQENDWSSTTASVAGEKQLFRRNTVVSASYALTRNNVGRRDDPAFERRLDVHTVELGASQLLDRKTRAGGGYTLQVWSGFGSSPYRFVPTTEGSRPPERHPDSRLRQALSGYVLRSLTGWLAGRLSYRFYMDDWGVVAHTGSLRLAFAPIERLSASLEGRLYWQDSADFYQQTYMTTKRYMTNDRELSTFWDAGTNVNVDAHVGPVDAGISAGFIHYRFANFTPLAKRNAMLVGAGARLRW